jgi:hypothetical protein
MDSSKIWQQAATFLLGIVMTGLTFYVAFTKDTPTKAEVVQIAADFSLYNKEREAVLLRIQRQEEAYARLADDLKDLSDRIGDLKIEVGKVGVKVGQLQETLDATRRR